MKKKNTYFISILNFKKFNIIAVIYVKPTVAINSCILKISYYYMDALHGR